MAQMPIMLRATSYVILMAFAMWGMVPLAGGDGAKNEFVTLTDPVNGKEYPLYPEILPQKPTIPSPYTTNDGQEYLVVGTHDGRFALVRATLTNQGILPPNAKKWRIMHGNQLHIDGNDFPYLVLDGLHNEESLKQIRTITWKSVDEITAEGRPNQSSGVGFMAEDEDLISVLIGANRLVSKLGLTHPSVARITFHVYNTLIQETMQGSIRNPDTQNQIVEIFYNGQTVRIKAWGTKGHQESLFNDEIRGLMQFELWRELSEKEDELLQKRYARLSRQQMKELKHRLTFIHTGEMVPYYIMRYGFYEGHTDYRADPIAIAWLFGLKSLEELDETFDGKLYETLTAHFTKENYISIILSQRERRL